MSANFPKNPSDSSLPDIGMSNPGNTAYMEQGQFTGGRTKIKQSATPAHPTEQTGYGYMSPALKNVGYATGENTSGIPAAQPINPMTFGDPNDTSLDFRDGSNPNTVTIQGGGVGDIARYGFDKPAI